MKIGEDTKSAAITVTAAERRIVLFCAEDPVACVAETGDDIGVVIEALVKSCTVYGNIGMLFVNALDRFGSCYHAYHAEIGAAAAYVEDKLDDLLMMGYLKKTAGKYRTTFFIRDAAFKCAQKQFEMQLLPSLAEAIYTVITRHIDDIRSIGFLGNDLDENLLLWDFITAAAHSYMEEYSIPISDKMPLRGDGSSHWIDASWSNDAIIEAIDEISPELYDYIRYSEGCAGKYTGADTAFIQQFDPPILCGYREMDSNTVRQLISAAAQAREGLSDDEHDRMMLTRAIENGMAEMVDGTVHMRIPCFSEEQYKAYRTLTDTVLLPEIAATCGDSFAKQYFDFITALLPADLDTAEKEFVGTRFYVPNAIPYLLYRAGKLSLPENADCNVCTMLFTYE